MSDSKRNSHLKYSIQVFLFLWPLLLVSAAQGQDLWEFGPGTEPVWNPQGLQIEIPLLSHPVFDYMERWETRQSVPLISQTKPYLGYFYHPAGGVLLGKTSDHPMRPPYPRRWSASRPLDRETSRYFQELDLRHWPAERAEYEYFANHGWKPVNARLSFSKWTKWIYADGVHFGYMAIGRMEPHYLRLTFQPVYGLELINTDDSRGRLSRFTSGARIEGNYAKKLRFMVDFRDNTETGNGPYFTRAQLYEDRWPSVDLKGKSATSYNVSESFLQYYGRDLSIAAGRGRHQWGPGQFGGLFLNSYAPPFDYLRFDAVMEDEQSPRAIYYTFLHGFLQSATSAETLYVIPDGRPRTLNAEKYLSAQRLEIRPRPNLLLGLSQGVIYGDRGLEFSYLTPLNFLYSVQHSNDDKDNFMLGLDGTWRIVRGLKLYSELLFDDIVVGDLFSSTGNNKSAYTVGAHGIIPRPIWSKFDLRFEYTKVRPFVYSHFFTVNTYGHWYSPLGYTREPNSEFMTTELRGTFYPVQVTLHWSRQNHGADTETQIVGGSIYNANFEGNDKEFPFLAGSFERTTKLGLRVSWEPLPNLILFGEGMQIQQSRLNDRFETRAGFGWNL